MSTDLTPSSRLQRRPDCSACEMDGEMVLMSLERGAYYALDEIATVIWELLAQPQTPAALVARMTQEFEVTPAECQADLDELLAFLLQEKLVSVLPPG